MNVENVLRELIDENPFAARSVLKLLRLRFTDEVPTLAVTCRERPELLVNPGFVNRHCRTEGHLKAVLCHEFLHLLLRHTEVRGPYDRARHLAFDAVINAMIHRQHGEPYSSMMAEYYHDARGPVRLLRPPTADEALQKGFLPDLWKALYAGRLVADDLEELARDLGRSGAREESALLLGNHEDLGHPLPGPLTEALNQTLRELNGGGIWRSPRGWGVGAAAYETALRSEAPTRRDWERDLKALLRRHLVPDKRSRVTEDRPAERLLPVLSPSDRRAFVLSLWSPFLPESRWTASHSEPAGTAQLYLDVSGSMNAELAVLAGLLHRLGPYLRRPFWAFSDKVFPAVIEGGVLRTSTNGGTSLKAVLTHLAQTQPRAAVVVTDGYVEDLDPSDLKACRGIRLHVLVSARGKPDKLTAAGLPWTQLKEVPR